MYLIRDIDKSQDYIITVQNMDGPLKNLLVLDLTRVLVGPYCTMMLSDLGARVIKVEAPEVGDDSRKFGPFIEDYSAYFMSLNRGKESIALNLKNEDDKKIFDKILAKADILVENFKPGTLEKWGYGWKDVCKKYPRLIYASASGFGQTGPLKELPAYDMVVQGMGGLMSVTGQPTLNQQELVHLLEILLRAYLQPLELMQPFMIEKKLVRELLLMFQC